MCVCVCVCVCVQLFVTTYGFNVVAHACAVVCYVCMCVSEVVCMARGM